MATRKIAQADLQHYFDNFSSITPAQLVEIEVAGLDIGDQIEAEWVALKGITYDPQDDQIIVNLADQLQSAISGPQEVYVTEDDNGIHAIEITCSKGHKHIIKLKNPLLLTTA